MLNTIVLIAYLVALAVFVFMSVLAIRHTTKFGYISQKFKTLAWVFGIVVLAIILFSAYLMTSLFKSDPRINVPTTSVKNIDF